MAQDVIQFLDLPTIWRGLPWTVTLIARFATGVPCDLTGFTMYAGSATGVNLNPVVAVGTGGLFSLNLTSVQSQLLVVGRYPYDVTGTKGNFYFTEPFYAGDLIVKQTQSIPCPYG